MFCLGLGLERKLRVETEVLLLDRARTPIDLVQSVSSLYQVADLTSSDSSELAYRDWSWIWSSTSE